MTTYGLTPEGFVPKQQQIIISEIYASLQGTFGVNLNTAARSVFSQFVGIFAGREALLWQLAEAVYVSQYPGGAEGTSVDNVLALSGLKRLGATPTVTNPDSLTGSGGIRQFGLVLFGTAGTAVPKDSIIQTDDAPPLSFTLDASVTIAAAVNAIQQLTFSAAPTSGTFQLTFTDNNSNVLDANGNVIQYGGNQLTTPPFSMATANFDTGGQLTFGGLPAAASGFKIALTAGAVTLTTATIVTNAAYPTAAAIQSAIAALTGYTAVSVFNPSTGIYYIVSPANIPNPILSITANTTTQTITPLQSLQALINNLNDAASVTNPYPYSDVEIQNTISSGQQGYLLKFGGSLFPLAGSLPSGAQPVALLSLASNTQLAGSTAVTASIVTTQTGAPAQGKGSAKATVTGPNSALAGTITEIGSPVSGWTGVTNQLDALAGTNTEDDTQALLRRSSLLSANANGPLQSIIAKVTEVVTDPPITAVLGFQNLTGAADQQITFSGTVTPGGGFQINANGAVTAAITINSTDSDAGRIQTALRALAGYSTALVVGDVPDGFTVSWNGSQGGQPLPLLGVLGNSTGATITPSFGRPGHSVEIVVDGGSISDIAAAIFGSIPGGIQAYGRPFPATGNTSTVTNPTVLTSIADTSGIVQGMLASGAGIPPQTFVVAVTSSTVTLSQNVVATATGVALSFTYTAYEQDVYGNTYPISFSRPIQTPIFVKLALTTDIYNTPGDNTSGLNPNAEFQVGSLTTIVQDILTIGNATPIGGRVIGRGTNGLVGAFNSVPGIVGYVLGFGKTVNPSGQGFIQLLPEQRAVFESLNVSVSYS